MTAPSVPAGYDETRHVQAGRMDCYITVGFDQQHQHIPRFLVQLHYQAETDPLRWCVIARMDHNETSVTGHDVYREGLHVDVDRRGKTTVHLDVPHSSLPPSRGTVIRACVEYLRREAEYFIDIFEGDRSPGRPPKWRPDGGRLTRTLIRLNLLERRMSHESPVENALAPEELSKLLADVEGTTAEEIERGAEEIEIAPPEEATVVGVSDE